MGSTKLGKIDIYWTGEKVLREIFTCERKSKFFENFIRTLQIFFWDKSKIQRNERLEASFFISHSCIFAVPINIGSFGVGKTFSPKFNFALKKVD